MYCGNSNGCGMLGKSNDICRAKLPNKCVCEVKNEQERECFSTPKMYSLHPSSTVILKRPSVSGRLEELGTYRPTTEPAGIRCCQCQQRQSNTQSWTKIKMLRWLGHCVLFLVFATCAGLVLNRTLNIDYTPHESVDQYIGGGDMSMGVQLEPVKLSEFRNSVRGASNPYALIRIFLKDKDISDDQIHELLTAKTLETLLSGKHEDKREEMHDVDYEDYDYPRMLSAGADQLEEELAEVYHHMHEMEISPLGQCKYPRPEIVHVEDEQDINRIYIPECTVIHRCRNVSGCCGNSSQECGPKRVQVVTKTFFVLSVTDSVSGAVVPYKNMVKSIPFVNHTECGCKERKGLPGCDQECPFPFKKFRPNLKCECDCFKGANEVNFYCQSMKDGLMPLAERELECIKSKRCMPPKCTRQNEEFDVRTGFCPELDDDNLGLHGYIDKTDKNGKAKIKNRGRKASWDRTWNRKSKHRGK